MPFILQLSVSFVWVLGRAFFWMSLCHCQELAVLSGISCYLSTHLPRHTRRSARHQAMAMGPRVGPDLRPSYEQRTSHNHLTCARLLDSWNAKMNCRFCKDFLQLLAACTLCNKFQRACFQQCRHFSCHCRFRFRLKSLGRARPVYIPSSRKMPCKALRLATTNSFYLAWQCCR